MTGTVLITGANSSSGIPAVEHLLLTYPDHNLVLTVRDASSADVNTEHLRAVVKKYGSAGVTIRPLDLSQLSSVHEFADEMSASIASGERSPLTAIIAIAYYWNLVGDPEYTTDGFDKTFQVSHIAHSALILRLIGKLSRKGRIVLLSSDSHWPGKNSMEKYPPAVPSENLDVLVHPFIDQDKQGRGYQRYATAKLAITTWMYPLNRYLQKNPELVEITAVALNPGNLVDSRALTNNTPVSLHMMQRFVFKPLLPLLQMLMGPTLRTSRPAGIDIIELALSPKHADTRGFFTLLQKDESSPDSQNFDKQEALWHKTLEWAGINGNNTAIGIDRP